jgi:hypothetical protein
MLLDPTDLRNPELSLKCRECDRRLTYVGTHGPSDKRPEMHIYRCAKHGLLPYDTRSMNLGHRLADYC